MKFKLIVATVKQNITNDVVDVAREAGATGATIIPARGIGMEEKKTFFGLSIEGPTDVVLFVVEEHVSDDILRALTEKCKIQEPGMGMAFSVPIEELAGAESQMKKFREQARDQYI